jgi:hypothetical protein
MPNRSIGHRAESIGQEIAVVGVLANDSRMLSVSPCEKGERQTAKGKRPALIIHVGDQTDP